ncbi:MAG: DUF4430 domain-containing protein [Gaiellaceae bacterium]
MRYALLVLLAALAAGCGSAAGAGGQATLWVTRDRGAVVVEAAHVPVGLSAAQALERVTKVQTRYGGRYVHAVDGVAEHGQRSWFYYVNGYLADRSAADFRLRPGDVAWWDYRSWRDPAQDPVVVGAFPEPFLHGYDGKRRPAVVVTADRAAGRRLASLVRGRWARPGTALPANANVLVLRSGPTRFSARLTGPSVRMTFSGDWRRLLRGRYPFRFRYAVG